MNSSRNGPFNNKDKNLDLKINLANNKSISPESFLKMDDNESNELIHGYNSLDDYKSSDFLKSRKFSFSSDINKDNFHNKESNKNSSNSKKKNNNESITEFINHKLQDHFENINHFEKIKFLISSNFAFECIRKLNTLPPIRIYELWKSTPMEIKQVLFNTFLIILTNRIRIWSNIDTKQKDYFILWGCNYLNQIGDYLSIPEIIIEKMIKIYYLNVDDQNSENFSDLKPLKDCLIEYCNNELQPKVNILFNEYNNINNNVRSKMIIKQNKDLNAESFLFLRNNSAFEVLYKGSEWSINKNSRTCSLNNRLSLGMTDLPLNSPNDFYNNLKLFNSNNINYKNNINTKVNDRRRKTWHSGISKLEYILDEQAPNSFLIIILSFLRLHAIDGILNSRTLSILQEIYLVLNNNNEYYKSSLLIFDSLQMLTFNDIKKTELKCDTKSLEKGWNKSMRYLKVAGATIVGGAVLAAATTIAAPGIIAGLGTLGLVFPGIFGTAVTAGTSAATISAVAGVGGAGLSGWKMSRRESPLQVFSFHQIGKNHDKCGLLPILIGISGWLRNSNDIFVPWEIAFNGVEWMETYAIEFEPEVLSKLGNSIAVTMSQDLAIFAGKAILLQTVVGTLTAALSWPITIMQYAATLDNTWSVSRQKTEKAAIILADVLCSIEITGNRPIKLVGYSMGARLIYLALQIMYDRKQFNKIQDVVLLGLPSSLNTKNWIKARCVVSNRLINVFSRSDWVLAFFYRYMQWGFHVAGISPVNIASIENYDVTGMITSHDQYPDKIREILYYINFF
ncbi:uncharacterized protein cubi_01574 [Cryptosporidium ubiquitum]|uniref:Transmembrane protein n=1 Tax=Cryptosporidium ubiquitum TaxID=857276 RepID=A0A1J4MDD9_9CRYT|nr:uncharacterized protein cubi_01574 [Cryptosporidium ubiquitum]OII72241.1 hypothetical protein cubi_01574 [Cryptosporidium ubiquitum]